MPQRRQTRSTLSNQLQRSGTRGQGNTAVGPRSNRATAVAIVGGAFNGVSQVEPDGQQSVIPFTGTGFLFGDGSFIDAPVSAVSGTPVDNQVAVWTSASVLEGDPLFTWDGSVLLATVFQSSIATGTAPLIVASTTLVTNLNADLLDGLHAAAFATSVHTHDHGADLTGLLDDDHTQYALLAGRSGGQVLRGGTGAGDQVTFRSTTHATKGVMRVEDTVAFELANSGAAAAIELRLWEPNAGGSSYTGFIAPALAGNVVYTLPTADATASGQVLSSNSSAVLSWIDHGGLPGLGDDDHTQYALLLGRSGGQTLIGGTASGNNLALQSTSHATKGAITFGATALGYYDEATGFLELANSAISAAQTDARLKINILDTATSGNLVGIQSDVIPNPGSVSSLVAIGGEISVITLGSVNITGAMSGLKLAAASLNTATMSDMRGVELQGLNLGAGTITNLTGGLFTLINNVAGTISNGWCGNFVLINNSTGTIGACIGLNISLQNDNAGTITTAYGVRIDSLTGTGTHTNTSYSFYAEDAASVNFFNQMTGIGVQAAFLPGTGTFGLVFADGTALASMGSNTAGLFANDDGGTVKMYAIDEADSIALLNYRNIALGGGAAPTLGTIGGSGPTVAAQNSWLEFNIGGTAYWVPAWI